MDSRFLVRPVLIVFGAMLISVAWGLVTKTRWVASPFSLVIARFGLFLCVLRIANVEAALMAM